MNRVSDKDMGLIDICKALKRLGNTSLSVGVFSDAINNKGTGRTYVADYAITNEYGNENIPERSFIRSTMDERQEEWSNLMSNLAENITEGRAKDLSKKIYEIGELTRKDIIKKIDSNINPPNSPATLKKKGLHKNKTLIDDGVLRSSIEAKITDKK